MSSVLKLKPEFKELWLQALRSGKFEQGSGALRLTDHGKEKYCCLGVACVITDEYIYDEDIFPKPEVWFSWFVNEAKYHFMAANDLKHKLASMNDVGVSFADIATYIEENL